MSFNVCLKEHLGGRKPTPEMIPPASQKPKRVPQQCRQFVRLIGKLSNILSKDPASDALVLGRLKLAIATLKEQDETISIEPEVYRGAQTVTDFFMVMAKYWNCYDDYDLLEMVIESTENEEAMKILNDFLQNRDRGVIVPTEKCPEAPFQNIRDRGVGEFTEEGRYHVVGSVCWRKISWKCVQTLQKKFSRFVFSRFLFL